MLMTLGWTYFTSGAFMHAEAMFRRARAIDPTVRNADILNGLGWSLNNRGQHREAEEVFLEGLRINPRQGAILNGLQSLSTARGDYASAKQHVRAWIAAAPDWMFARALLVRVHLLGGELDAAQTALEEGLKAASSDALRRDLLVQAGWHYLGQGRRSDAQALFERARALDVKTEDREVINAIATLLAQQGNDAAAEQLFVEGPCAPAVRSRHH
jgi:Flp pilus assembly protein TadD